MSEPHVPDTRCALTTIEVPAAADGRAKKRFFSCSLAFVYLSLLPAAILIIIVRDYRGDCLNYRSSVRGGRFNLRVHLNNTPRESF